MTQEELDAMLERMYGAPLSEADLARARVEKSTIQQAIVRMCKTLEDAGIDPAGILTGLAYEAAIRHGAHNRRVVDLAWGMELGRFLQWIGEQACRSHVEARAAWLKTAPPVVAAGPRAVQ